MTATATRELLSIQLAQIQPSKFNPRKTFDEQALKELANNIGLYGVKQPILVRPNAVDGRADKMAKPGAPYEIVVGERRFRAAKLAGLERIPAIVEELDDNQVREIQIIENLQRADMSAMEEATAYAELCDRTGLGYTDSKAIESIAKKVSRRPDYVAKRLKLVHLIPDAQKYFREGDIHLGHIELLATLEKADQEKALRFIFDPQGYHKRDTLTDLVKFVRKEEDKEAAEYSWAQREPATEKELRNFIESQIALSLKKAPWDLTDARLVPEAGACLECPKQTAHNKHLFGGLLRFDEPTCTDAACFKRKGAALVYDITNSLQEAGKDVVRISHRKSTIKPKDTAETFKLGQFNFVEKGEKCDSTVTGVWVDASGPYDNTHHFPGAKAQVCVDAKCKKHKKPYQRSKAQRSGGYDHAAEEKKRQQRERLCKQEEQVRRAIVELALAKVTKLTPKLLTALLVQAVAGRNHLVTEKQALAADPRKENDFAQIVARVIAGDYVKPWYDPKGESKEFNNAIAWMGSDAGQLRKKAEKQLLAVEGEAAE